jgi:hypothetical protein
MILGRLSSPWWELDLWLNRPPFFVSVAVGPKSVGRYSGSAAPATEDRPTAIHFVAADNAAANVEPPIGDTSNLRRGEPIIGTVREPIADVADKPA